MKKFVLFLFLIFSLSITHPLFSDDLGDFKDNVEQEEKENQNEESDTYDKDSNGSGSSPFLEFLWDVTFFLWFIHNDSVYYAPYPYEQNSWQSRDNFIGHDLRTYEEIERNSLYRKNYNFAFHGMATIDENLNTIGGMARFSGKFTNHFGPELDYRLFWDGDDLFHIATTGLNLSFFQFNFMSLDFYVEGAFFMGLLERQGISLGAKITSYPFRPVSLEIRSGGMFFESITFAEIEAKLGFHFGRTEIFADFYTLQSEQSALYSFGIGAGVHF